MLPITISFVSSSGRALLLLLGHRLDYLVEELDEELEELVTLARLLIRLVYHVELAADRVLLVDLFEHLLLLFDEFVGLNHELGDFLTINIRVDVLNSLQNDLKVGLCLRESYIC